MILNILIVSDNLQRPTHNILEFLFFLGFHVTANVVTRIVKAPLETAMSFLSFAHVKWN